MQTTATGRLELRNRSWTWGDWVGTLGLPSGAWTWGNWVAIGLGVLIGLTPFLVGVPENHTLVLRSALVGVAVWGAP